MGMERERRGLRIQDYGRSEDRSAVVMLSNCLMFLDNQLNGKLGHRHGTQFM
jgi:hypothetical protein